MASIFKQKYTVPGKNGKRIRKQSKFWYIDYKAADGTRKRVKGFKDKQATAKLAAKLEKEAELAQAGVVDKYAEHRKRPLIKHAEDFRASLINRGTTEKHARLVHYRAKTTVEACRFVYIADISASRIQRYLAERRRGGLSIRSSNFYLQAIKQFCRWLVADSRTGENPLEYLKAQNPKTDIRRSRRALSADELERLIEATAQSHKHSGMTGKERVMLYTLAVSTGLRAGELASLTWQSFNLSDSEPSVTVLAAYSKHRRDDVIPLRSDIAELFAQWQRELNARDESKVFCSFDSNKGAGTLRKDLEAAGIPYRDEAGRVADFHSLRHTFISNLSRSGVSPKVAQSLARHSTIGLTMDTYTHLSLYDERAALDKLPVLPNIGGTDKGKAVALRTGTDDLPVESTESAYKPAYQKLTKNGYSDNNHLSSNDLSVGFEDEQPSNTDSEANLLSVGALGGDSDRLSSTDSQRRRRDSNPRCLTAQRFSRPPP